MPNGRGPSSTAARLVMPCYQFQLGGASGASAAGPDDALPRAAIGRLLYSC